MPIWLRLILFLLLISLAEYYSFIVIRSALRTASPAVRAVVFTFYFLLTAVCYVGLFFFRTINWDNVPSIVRTLYVSVTLGLVVGKVLILAVMLIDDLRRLVLWIVGYVQHSRSNGDALSGAAAPVKGITRSVFLQRLAGIVGLTALGGFVYGVTNRYRYRLRKVTVKVEGMPAGLRGLRIVQISDIHSGSFDSAEAVARGVELAMAQKPDIIFFTGDLVNNKEEEIVPYKDVFKKLSAPMGVYSTLGNHDYGDYYQWEDRTADHHEKERALGRHIQTPLQAANLERLKQHHADMGWRLLMNEHLILPYGDSTVGLIGIENWSAKPQFPKYGNMAAAYAGLPEKTPGVQILLSHDPSHWDAEVLTRFPEVHLMLAGHTHGMQFGVEIPGIKWSPVQYVYKKWAGLYTAGRQHLYVNRGFGFLGYPGRLGILPEITLLELG